MPENDRELHVAVRDPSGRRLLVAGDPPRLPTLTVTLAPDQTTVAAAASQLRDAWHITAPLLEVQFDYDADPESGPIPTLVVTEPAAVHPPTELRWHDLDLGEPAIHPALEPRLRELVEEWRTGAEPPDLRPRWARPGWHARATRWLTARLTALGRPPTGPVEQVRHWSISAVLRAPTDAGAVWMKAVFPPFHHEPAVTELLASTFPDRVPTVVATEPTEGWLVLEDLGTATVRDQGEAADRDAALRALIEIQHAMVARTGELRALGCPIRPLSALAAELASVVGGLSDLTTIDFDTTRSTVSVERVQAAADRVSAIGLPHTLVHGDFHTGNVALVRGRPVVFDWSDAAVGNPLVDLATWLAKAGPDERASSWSVVAEAWSDVAPAMAFDGLLDDVLVVGAAYQALSYVGIIRNMEPSRRAEFADDLAAYLAMAAGSGQVPA